MDRRWLAECNYIHWDNPSLEQGHLPTAAEPAACSGEREEDVTMGGIWSGHLGPTPKTDKPPLPKRPSGPPPDVITRRQVHGVGRGQSAKGAPTCIPIDDSFLLGMASGWDSELVSVPCSLFKAACFGGGSGTSGAGVTPPRVTLGGRVLLSRLSDELLRPDWLVTSLLWSWLSR